jgi:hypothetical protein
MPEDFQDQIRAWAAKQNDSPPLATAIRRLVEHGLASALPLRQQGKKAAATASKMAGRAIDSLGDKSVPPDVQEGRKRRLLKGPKEFRGMRGK